MNIENSVTIVTGASSGIGEATALKLAKEGGKVVLLARREDRLLALRQQIEKDGGHALVVAADVTSREQMNSVAKTTIDTYGRIDALINNAGIMPLSFIDKLKTDEWENMVDVNIKGVLNGVSAVLPEMLKNKSGQIVNVASTAAHAYFPGAAVYCATKSAVKMFSEGLRKELSPRYGINVTSIEPGAVATELINTITDQDVLDGFSAKPPMTVLESEDVANAIYYALTQPERVNVGDVYILPTQQK